MKMRYKITSCFLLCLSIAFVLLLMVVQAKTAQLSSSITLDLTQQLVQSKSDEIGMWFSERISQMRLAGEHDGLRTAAGQHSSSYLDRINCALKKDYSSLDTTFALVDNSGFGWLDDQHCIDLYGESFFREAMEGPGEYYLSMPVRSPIDGQHAIMITHPLSESSGRYGCLVGSIPVSRLEEALSDIRVFDGSVWIMDGEGRLVAQGKALATGSERDPQRFSLRALSRMLSDEQQTYSLRLTDGSMGSLTYCSIPYTPQWKLCVLASEAAMYKESRAVSQSIITIWLIILILSLFVCIALAHSLTQPLARLRQAMDAVEAGQLETRYQPKGHDEVAALGRSFSAMLGRIRALLNQVSHEQGAKHAAELRALQAQINPHFIYNTLDTLQWKALAHNAHEVADITAALSSFFRISLSEGREFITLNEEVEHTYHYLFIQQVRYANRLSFDIDLDPEMDKVLVPKLILQPLVENSLQHGIKPVSYNGHIDVRICRENDQIHICVKDNGAGMEADHLLALQKHIDASDPSLGYGLYNITERLRVRYGAAFHIFISSRKNEGTQIDLYLPYESKEKGGIFDDQTPDR